MIDAKSSSVTIAPAKPQDVPAILAVRKACWLESYPNDIYGITIEDLELKDFDSQSKIDQLSDEIATNSNLLVLVAKQGLKIVGCVFARKNDQYNEGENLYLLPNYRNLGLGKNLMSEGLEWLGHDKDLVIGVVAYNSSAITKYKKMGFGITCEILHDEGMLPNGKVIPGVKMVLPAYSN